MSIDDNALRDYVRRMAGYTLSTAWLDYPHLVDGAFALLKELATKAVPDIHGFTDVEKSMEMRAIDAESQADEFAAELDRMRADIKVYEARLRDRDNRVQELSLQVMDVERERDEARARADYWDKMHAKHCGSAICDAGFKTATNNDYDGQPQSYWDGWADGDTHARADLAQRDRRIAELETALRMIASGNPASPGKWLSDVQMADIARAALSAPAQPATATKEDGNMVQMIVRVERREEMTVEEAVRRVEGAIDEGAAGVTVYRVAAPPSPAAPLIVGRKVISEPGASIRLEVLELSEEAQRRLSVGKTAAANFLRASSPAAQCGRCNYMLTNDVVCTKCGWTPEEPVVKRNMSTPEAREFWRKAEEAAAEVSTWPDWKRAGINAAQLRDEPRPDVPSPAAPIVGSWICTRDGEAQPIRAEIPSCPKCGTPMVFTNHILPDDFDDGAREAKKMVMCSHGINHSGQRHGCDGCCKASAVISSNRDEDAAWTAHKALVQARATIKLAVECEDGIDGAQAEVTFRMIAAALAALDVARKTK